MEISLISVLDYAGVATFAASGALMAAQKRQDVITFIFFAAITGVGGGTLRDLLIGADVFWVVDAGYIVVCTVVAILVYLTRGRGVHEQTLLWLDAVGLCVYACVGAAKALSLGVDPVICVVMGALTATFGGIIRDVLAGVPSILLSRELYITPAIYLTLESMTEAFKAWCLRRKERRAGSNAAPAEAHVVNQALGADRSVIDGAE